ncbi:MAG: alanine:cation symporter family protein, partial [Bdellovibrionales bacterium]|nr:alanine:cation symporter family protein [Bdellovibrionales bacterium]
IMVTGIQRAAFSNEAGLGSAAIAHAAAKTDEPIREGLVAMLGPFIDTIIVCMMTSLVVVVTGTYADPVLAAQGGNIGVTLTTEAFRSVIPWFPYVLTICIGLFAYSTMISWCYYGERGWIYLMEQFGFHGGRSVAIFRIVFVCAVMVGATHPLSDVIDFTDAMVLGLALPNIFGSLFLASDVRSHLRDYFDRYRRGVFNTNG